MTDLDVLLAAAGRALWVTLLVCGPLLAAALLVGLIVGIIQAATSINDATLSFVPKLLIVGVVLAGMGGIMLLWIGDFARDMFALITELPGR